MQRENFTGYARLSFSSPEHFFNAATIKFVSHGASMVLAEMHSQICKRAVKASFMLRAFTTWPFWAYVSCNNICVLCLVMNFHIFPFGEISFANVTFGTSSHCNKSNVVRNGMFRMFHNQESTGLNVLASPIATMPANWTKKCISFVSNIYIIG